jgi:hypothetical protein
VIFTSNPIPILKTAFDAVKFHALWALRQANIRLHIPVKVDTELD